MFYFDGVLARMTSNLQCCRTQVGTTTDEIDKELHEMIVSHNAYPSPLNYMGFPKCVCTSVNNVACHGIPDWYALEVVRN